MISEFLLDIIFGIVTVILSPIPDVNVTFQSGALNTFWGVVRCALYLLPLDTISAIVTILVAIGVFRVFISIVRTIWDLLPIV